MSGQNIATRKLTYLVDAKPFGATFHMVNMLARQIYLPISSLISHLANHTSVSQIPDIIQRLEDGAQTLVHDCGNVKRKRKQELQTKEFKRKAIYKESYLSSDFFLEKKPPDLYFVVGSMLISSWERPRLSVPTASLKSSNSCRTKTN